MQKNLLIKFFQNLIYSLYKIIIRISNKKNKKNKFLINHFNFNAAHLIIL